MTRKRFSLGLLIALLASGIATTEASGTRRDDECDDAGRPYPGSDRTRK